MEIQFKVDAGEFNRALKLVSIVSPQMTSQQEKGFLFLVKGTTCFVYSKNGGHEARSSFEIYEVMGEGSFMYPSDYIGALFFVKGAIEFTATAEGEVFAVKSIFGLASGTPGVKMHASFDPRAMNLFEKDIQDAVSSQEPKIFNIKILRKALGSAKTFVAKDDKASHEYYRTIQVFGDSELDNLKKANGYMFASNGNQAFYFKTSTFMNTGFTVPHQHLPLLESFMGQSAGSLKVYTTARGFYVMNEKNDVIGWPHHSETYKKFNYYTKDKDTVVTVTTKDVYSQLQFMHASMAEKSSRIQWHINTGDKRMWFSLTDEGNNVVSLPVPLIKIEHDKFDGKERTTNINVNHMLGLFEDSAGDTIEFRIMATSKEGQKDQYFFRTIDSFYLNGESGDLMIGDPKQDQDEKQHKDPPEGAQVCQVTRFMPGMD